MSPISEKFLNFRLKRGEAPGATIDADRPCANCGYNLRGLAIGRNCPECGQPIRRRMDSGRPDDLLCSGDPLVRRRMQTGLALGTLCLIAAVLGRWAALAGALATGNASVIYALGITANGVVWVAAVWIMTPPEIGHQWPRLGPLRWFVRLSQCGWPVGLALLAWAKHGGVSQALEDDLMKWQVMVRFGAGVGALGLIALMHAVARGADLESAVRRLSLAGWVVPITVVVVWSYPSQFPWVFLLLLLILLVAWSWAMAWFALALWEMQHAAAWSLRAMHEAVQREIRVAEKRAELDGEAASIVRPLATKHSTDLPLEP